MKKKTKKEVKNKVIEIHIYVHQDGVWTTPNYTPAVPFPNPNITPNTTPLPPCYVTC